jgi:hypothetical protein
MKLSITSLIFALTVFAVADLMARPARVNQIPNGQKYSCQGCHFNPGGGGARNPFGETVNDNLENGQVRWDLIFNIDSDGDGRTNGEELLDPDGNWSQGQANPGNLEDVTHPGVSDATTVDITNNPETSLFPLPAIDKVTLEFNSNYTGVGELSVIDLNGNSVYSISEMTRFGANEMTIDLLDLNLSEGVYFIVFRNKYNVIKRKLIIN